MSQVLSITIFRHDRTDWTSTRGYNNRRPNTRTDIIHNNRLTIEPTIDTIIDLQTQEPTIDTIIDVQTLEPTLDTIVYLQNLQTQEQY